MGLHPRVAVLTSGALLRYFPEQTATKLIAPMVEEGFIVDCFLSLNSEPFVAWKGYARLFRPDPTVAGRGSNLTSVADLLNRTLSGAGATVRTLALPERVSLDEEATEPFLLHRARSGGWFADDPNPERTSAAKLSVLKLLHQFEFLWGRLLATEAAHGRYDFVISARDDVLWMRPFSLRAVLGAPDRLPFDDDPWGPLPSHRLPGPPQGYHARCTELLAASSYDAQREHGVTEYVVVYRREVAAPFLALYTRLLGDRRYWEVKNLESFIEVVAEEERVHLAALPARLIPMSRAGRVEVEGKLTTCLHKACDSRVRGGSFLRPMDGVPPCQAAPFSWQRLVRSIPPSSLFPSDHSLAPTA